MDHPDSVRRARSISLAGCESCQCGAVHIQLLDADGAVFAVGILPLDTAAALCVGLTGLVRAGLERRELDCAGNA